MPKIKYDVSNVDDVADGVHAPVGIYRAKVRSIDGPKPSSKGNQMLEVVFDLTHDASGKKLKEQYMPLWYYPILDHDHEFVKARLKEFLLAFGLKPKGELDTDKIVGKSVQLKLKSDTDQDGDYRPKVGKVMALAVEEEGEEPEPEEEDEEELPEEELDLDTLDRSELKKLIKEEGLEIKVLKSMSDDDLREAIADAMGVEEEEPEEPEDEEEEEDDEEESESAEDEDDGYDSMSVADLKSELKERELPTNGAKKVLIGRLRKDDGGDPF